MSTSNLPSERTKLDAAINDIEDAIGDLHQARVFENLSLLDREDLDTDAIADHAAKLETALEVAADLLTNMIEPGADEAPSLDEILARFVRDVVNEESVETAGTLLECLGSTGSKPGDPGLSIGEEIDYDSLEDLVEDLRELAQHLAPE